MRSTAAYQPFFLILVMHRQVRRFVFAFILLCTVGLLSACDSELSSDEYIANGLVYFEKQDWKSAIIEFRNAVKTSPENARARALLGQSYIETGSVNAAIKELNRAIELGYDKSRLALPLANSYRQAGEAQRIVDEIVADDGQTDTDKALLYAFRGSALLSLGDKVAARAALDKARRLDGEATEVRLAWARFESVNRDVTAQEQWLQPLLERDGGVADAWSQMGVIEQSRGNNPAAENALSRAIEIRQAPHFDYVRRALTRIALNDVEGAEADIAVLKDAGANWPMITYAEGMIDYRQRNYAAAQAHFLETQVQLPAYPAAKVMTGLSYFYQQKYQDASIYLKQFLEQNAGNTEVALVYATSLLAVNESAEALEVLQKLNSSNPDNFRILSLLSRAYRMQGKIEQSLETLQKAVKISPDAAETRLQLGVTLMDNPDTAAAGQQELKRALELDPSLENARYVLYMSHMRQKEFDKALQVAREIEQLDDKKTTGANLIALVYLGQGNVDRAKQLLRDTLERFPADIVTSNNLGRIYLSENALVEARALYSEVIKNNPNHIRSLEQMALISAREGNVGDMMQWLTKAVERNPRQVRPRLILASQYLQQGEFSESARILDDVDVEAKQGAGYIILMSRAKIGLREYDRARRLLEGLIERQPDIGVAYFLLAQVYAAGSDLEKTRQALEQTVRIIPDNLAAHIFLARLDLYDGDESAFDRRLADLEKRFPGNTQLALLRAQKSGLDEDYQTAIRQLSDMLAESSRADVVKELARNQWRSGDRQGAISSLELWSESQKDNSVLLMLAELYLLEQREKEAAAAYAALEQELPENPAVLNNLAWSLKDSDPEKGLEYARRANQLQPANPLILDTLALLQLKNGEPAKALETVRRAAQQAPDVKDIQFNLADILKANGKVDEARDVLKRLIERVEQEETKALIRNRIDNL